MRIYKIDYDFSNPIKKSVTVPQDVEYGFVFPNNPCVNNITLHNNKRFLADFQVSKSLPEISNSKVFAFVPCEGTGTYTEPIPGIGETYTLKFKKGQTTCCIDIIGVESDYVDINADDGSSDGGSSYQYIVEDSACSKVKLGYHKDTGCLINNVEIASNYDMRITGGQVELTFSNNFSLKDVGSCIFYTNGNEIQLGCTDTIHSEINFNNYDGIIFNSNVGFCFYAPYWKINGRNIDIEKFLNEYGID